MGYRPYYQAIPESSDLYRLMQTDQPAAKLMALFADKGSRPLDLLEGGEDEVDDLLEFAIEDDEVFASREDAEAAFQRLKEAIDRTVKAHRGLMDRCALLNKSQDELERLLVLHCSGLGDEESVEFLPALFGGSRPFAGPLFDPNEPDLDEDSAPEIAQFSPFWLVPSEDVKRGAGLLEPIAFSELASADESMSDATVEWLEDDYPRWRSLYLHAASRGEAIMVI